MRKKASDMAIYQPTDPHTTTHSPSGHSTSLRNSNSPFANYRN